MLFSMSMNRISLCVLLTSAFVKRRYFLLQFVLLLEFFVFFLPVARTDRLQFVSLHYKVDLWVSDRCRTAFIDHIRNKTEFFITSLSNFGFIVMWKIGIHFACTWHKRNHSASRPTQQKRAIFVSTIGRLKERTPFFFCNLYRVLFSRIRFSAMNLL